MSLLETYVLAETNKALNTQLYPVAGIAYAYYRKPRKVGKDMLPEPVWEYMRVSILNLSAWNLSGQTS